MKTITMELGERSYDIHVERGSLSSADKYFNLNRKVLVLTDSGVPSEYAKTVASLAKDALIVTVDEGEGSKSYETLGRVLQRMLEFGMTRTDCAVAVGGGVVGDLCGFAASVYMRGIDFYNIPTTVLSQVDSSIGGKCAINFEGVKNIVGAFHQPRGVLIDPDTLNTLPKRQISNGLAEAVKMSLTSDAELFSIFEREGVNDSNIENIIIRSLMIKKRVVEEDERESGLRKILNFGHTFAHAVEADEHLHGLYHGECVAIGMCVVLGEKIRDRALAVLDSLELPTSYGGDIARACDFISHDKKCDGEKISIVYVDEIGSFRIEKLTVEDFIETVKEYYKK
ncbi:MAG: 3-dehydroquinate synthase [Clostridia bacterium]|nr:3-dehydroquinate synthase [Clostridia bacterium]